MFCTDPHRTYLLYNRFVLILKAKSVVVKHLTDILLMIYEITKGMILIYLLFANFVAISLINGSRILISWTSKGNFDIWY